MRTGDGGRGRQRGRRRSGGGFWGAAAPRVAGVALAAVAAGACGGAGEGAERSVAPTPVDAVVASRDTIHVEVRSVGSLEARAHVELRAETDLRVSRVLFREGEPVERGQVLVLLDQDKLRAEAEAARAAEVRVRAEAENLRRQVERNRGLLEAGAISRQAYDDLETRHEAAEARLAEAGAGRALARERLAEATVRAPFAGRVGERLVDPGDFARKGDPLVTVVDDEVLEIGFSVPERYVGRLRIGSRVTLRVQSHAERSFEGAVTFVSPVVDVATRTVRLKAEVPNPERVLRAGQFADVTLGLESRTEAVVVPEAAIVLRGGEAFVFLVRDGVARRQEVRVGERSPGLVEMASGVQPGDTVVVAGQQKIRDGSPVAPTLRPLRFELEPPGGTEATAAAAEATGA